MRLEDVSLAVKWGSLPAVAHEGVVVHDGFYCTKFLLWPCWNGGSYSFTPHFMLNTFNTDLLNKVNSIQRLVKPALAPSQVSAGSNDMLMNPNFQRSNWSAASAHASSRWRIATGFPIPVQELASRECTRVLMLTSRYGVSNYGKWGQESAPGHV